MKTVKLNNGVEMPLLGFGVYQIPDPAQCERAVGDALKAGYRMIDTAAAYLNEQAVGRAVRNSGIPREEIFIITKLWIQDQGYEQALQAFYRSLDRLGMQYVDLYLIHQPFGDVYGSWSAMEELYRKGKARAIGVSNFTPDRIADLMLFNEIPPAVNQIETHPFCQQVRTQEFLEQSGVSMQSWGPFAEGRNDLFSNPILTRIAGQHRKTVAQVVLRWLMQRNVIAIPKSVNKERIEENFDIFDFELSTADMESIAGLDTGRSLFLDHRDPDTVKWLGTTRFDI